MMEFVCDDDNNKSTEISNENHDLMVTDINNENKNQDSIATDASNENNNQVSVAIDVNDQNGSQGLVTTDVSNENNNQVSVIVEVSNQNVSQDSFKTDANDKNNEQSIMTNVNDTNDDQDSIIVTNANDKNSNLDSVMTDVSKNENQGSVAGDVSNDENQGSVAGDVSNDENQGSVAVDVSNDENQASVAVDVNNDENQGSVAVNVSNDENQGSLTTNDTSENLVFTAIDVSDSNENHDSVSTDSNDNNEDCGPIITEISNDNANCDPVVSEASDNIKSQSLVITDSNGKSENPDPVIDSCGKDENSSIKECVDNFVFEVAEEQDDVDIASPSSMIADRDNEQGVESCAPFQNLSVGLEEEKREVKEKEEESNKVLSENAESNISCENVESNTSCENTVLSVSSPPCESVSASADDKQVAPEAVTAEEDKLITDESTIDHSEVSFGAQDEENSRLAPPLDIKQEVMDESGSTFNENTTSYLEDFIFPSGDKNSTAPWESDSTAADEKSMPLKRFPKIVKAVESADYEVLEALYLVLFLQNAWDTEKILVQRILEFSGFKCDPNSEDVYTRKLNLCTLPKDILYKIKNLLGIRGSWTYLSESEQEKLILVNKILDFLHKPSRPKRRKRTLTLKASSRHSPKKRKPAPKKSAARAVAVNSPARAVAVNSPARAVAVNSPAVDDPDDPECMDMDTEDLSDKVSTQNENYILELEKVFKEQIANGTAPEVKLILKKLQLPNLAVSTLAVSKALDDKIPVQQIKKEVIEKEEKKEVEQKKPNEKKDKVHPSYDDTNSSNLEKNLGQSSEKKKPEEVPQVDTNTETLERKKLREFPLVFSSIEGTPEKLLNDIYYLLFMEKNLGAEEEIKAKIMEFDGFPFSKDSGEFSTRKGVLALMTENTVKDVARALYLDPKCDKEATIEHLLMFLMHPQEKLLRPTVVAPGMLSDCEVDIDELSDSDDSITCEVVSKKVECIDILSSDEEKDPNKKSATAPVVKKEKEDVKPKTTQPIQPAPPAAAVSETATAAAAPSSNVVRRLRDFVTIKKIVETHPNEYLVDIYNLLYMKNYQSDTLRKDILDFTGFKFDKNSPEYSRRKQFLDRMLYNSVRRIYNTLIHNTREVKVFSKPTMIGEIFQFLLKLPDTDTSVPPPRPPVVRTYSNFTTVTNILTTETLKSKDPSTVKLSDLKRVFQRVACFPCEYLVDVHKLLFMTDCEMKDIRTNIFGFRGFSFGVDSQEFKERKMFLEYLTFHSLRKISSVLTTKTVDLRNSTKHELANHLTEVLKEYTNTYLETEPIGPDLGLRAVPPSSTTDTTTSTSTTTTSTSKETAPATTDSSIEQIVVTPIIPSLQSSPTPTPEPTPTKNKNDDMDVTVSSSTSGDHSSTSRTPRTQSGTVLKDLLKDVSVSSSKDTLVPNITIKKEPISTNSYTTDSSSPGLRTDSPSSSTPSGKRKQEQQQTEAQKAKAMNEKKRQLSILARKRNVPQVEETKIPEVEKYRKMFKKDINIPPAPSTKEMSPVPVSSSTPMGYPPELLFQQVPQPMGSMINSTCAPSFGPLMTSSGARPLAPPLLTSAMQLPIIHPFQQQIPLQNSGYFVQSSPSYLKMDSDFSIPVECILQEGSAVVPPAKRLKQSMVPKFPGVEPLPGCEESLMVMNQKSTFLPEKRDEFENPSSSLQLKIRDAMTKTLEDEEDCDKPLATLVGHPNDRVLKQQICEIVEKTDLQDISINGVIQKIFSMYPKFNLNYRKEFIKSTLRSLLYRLGDDTKQDMSNNDSKISSHKADSSVTTTNKQTGSASRRLQKSS